MAGFVFLLDSAAALPRYTRMGVYGTILNKDPKGWWNSAYEATFGDYCSMQEGDAVFFFTNRKLYGVGRLTKVGSDCRYQNFPGATATPSAVEVTHDAFLLATPEATDRQRWICTFEPDPHFFVDGVDMDDALTYRPASFRTLRAMYQRSFVRIDDEEEQALRDVIYRANRHAFSAPKDEVFPTDHVSFHESIRRKLSPEYDINPDPLLQLCAGSDGSLNHEMALEAALVFELTEGAPGSMAVFGHLDYVSHQVTGSPPKPPIYIDHIDILGLTYLHGRTPSQYTVIELKKGAAGLGDVEQTMKYVDWVKDEYCFGDYSMVRSFLVAFDFQLEPEEVERTTLRSYTVGRRPAETRHWREFVAVRYRYSATSGLRLEIA